MVIDGYTGSTFDWPTWLGQIKVGAGTKIYHSEFDGPASIDRNSRLGGVKAGRYCNFGENSTIVRADYGSFCATGSCVSVNPYNHPTDWLSIHEFQFRTDSYDWIGEYRAVGRLQHTASRLRIGNDVWIGNNAVILNGSDIADGAIVAAGAVVTMPVPPYAIVAGVPARVKKYRFLPTIVERLLDLRWWELPLSDLNGLPFNDIHACIERLETIMAKAA